MTKMTNKILIKGEYKMIGFWCGLLVGALLGSSAGTIIACILLGCKGRDE